MKPSDILEGLDPQQKAAGQLGPTEKVKNNNIGKLVGANENFINTDVQAVVSEEDLDEHNHLIGVYRKGESQFQLWNEGQYQYKLTSMVGGVPKQYKQWNDFDLEEVKASLIQSGFQSMRTFTDESTKMDKNNLPKQYWNRDTQSIGPTPDDGLTYADPDEDGVHYPDYGNTNKPPRKFRVKDNDGDDETTDSRYIVNKKTKKPELRHRISIEKESINQGLAEGMFTKDPAIDPTIGKQINDIINRLHNHAKRTKDEYLRAAVRGAVQELFDILRNTGGTYSPPGSPGVRDVAEGEGNREMRDRIRSKGIVPGIDREKYTERPGLEGPFHTKTGKVVYYDKQEGKYYDPDTDFYISHDDYQAMNEQGMTEGSEQQLSIQQLATISDEALDNAYHYGRSSPGNTFGWQANLKSAAYAKQMIDKGVTDVEAISDAIHKGWNVTAQAFVQNPDQFDDTEKLKAAGKLEGKLQQRAQLMKQNYAQLPDEEKEKDRVVARALLQALKGQQGLAEGECPMCAEAGTTCKECSMQMESLSQILRNAGIKKV